MEDFCVWKIMGKKSSIQDWEPWCWTQLLHWFLWTWRHVPVFWLLLRQWTLSWLHPVNIIEKAICGLHTNDQSTKWIFPFWVYIVGHCLWKWNSELILSWWQDSQIQTSCRQGQFYFRQGRMEDEHIGASLCSHFLNPLWRIQKGLPVCKEGWHEAGIAQVEVMSIQTFSPDSFF